MKKSEIIKKMSVEEFYGLGEVTIESDGFWYSTEDYDGFAVHRIPPVTSEEEHLHPIYIETWEELKKAVAEEYEVEEEMAERQQKKREERNQDALNDIVFEHVYYAVRDEAETLTMDGAVEIFNTLEEAKKRFQEKDWLLTKTEKANRRILLCYGFLKELENDVINLDIIAEREYDYKGEEIGKEEETE